MKAFMRLEVSVEFSIWLNKCFRRFKRPLEFSDLLLSSLWSFSSAYNSKWSRCFWASQILWCGWRLLYEWKSLLRSQFDWRYVLDVLNVLLNILIYCLVFNDPSLQLIIASEVDVFMHPRFCDEFSHLVDEGFYSTGSLYWGLTLIL